MNKGILIAIIVALIVGGFFFFRYQNLDTPAKNIVAGENIEKNTPKKESVVKVGESFDDVDFDNIEGGIIYYYSFTCGHCKDVNAFLEKNDIASKVNFVKKEISENRENSKELSEVAQKCGLNPSSIGVPFLFADGKCYIGGPNVEAFFAKAAGL